MRRILDQFGGWLLTRWEDGRLRDVLLPRFMLVLASLLIASAAPGYLTGSASYGDDASSHLAVAVDLAHHFRHGDLDLWSPVFCLGSPAGYYYGPLPHLLLGGVIAWLGPFVPPTLLYKILLLLGLLALPWAMAAGARRIGQGPLAAAWSGFFALMVSSALAFGWSLETFLYQGLFAQLPGLLLLPIALGCVLRYLRSGQGLAAALVTHGLLVLCHPFTGQVVALVAALAALALPLEVGGPPRLRDWLRTTGRLALLGVGVALASAPYWAPMRAAWQYFGGWPAGKPAQWDGTGLGRLLEALVTGGLLDAHRLPVMSLAALAGILFWIGMLWRRSRAASTTPGERPHLLALLLTGVAVTLLAAGRVTFGELVDWLPLHRHMELSRYLVPLHLILILAAGDGVAWLSRLAGRIARRSGPEPGPVMWLSFTLNSLILVMFLAGPLGERLASRVNLFRTSERYFTSTSAREAEQFIASLGPGLPGRLFAHGSTGLGTHFWMGLPAALSGRPMLFSYGAGYQDSAGAGPIEEVTPRLDREHAVTVLQRFGVRFVLSTQDRFRPQLGPEVERHGDVRLQDLGAVPPFQVVRVPGTLCLPPTGRRAAVRAWLNSPLLTRGERIRFDPDCPPDPALAEYRALERWLAELPAEPQPAGRVTEWLELPSEWRARVVGAAPGDLLLLDQGLHPGWQVLVDGQPASRLELAPAFSGVALPPGDHEVIFRFQRPPWSWPLWALLPLLGGLAWLAQRGNRGTPGPDPRASGSPAGGCG